MRGRRGRGLTYRTLYKYHITDNRFADGAFRMEGNSARKTRRPRPFAPSSARWSAAGNITTIYERRGRMSAIYIVCFLASTVGIVLVLGLTPEQLTCDLAGLFQRRKSLREQSLNARARRNPAALRLPCRTSARLRRRRGRGSSFRLRLPHRDCFLWSAVPSPLPSETRSSSPFGGRLLP